ncbi:hypothetical protein RclHR1_08760012 [Rhizophagus clarus]|uniref:Uncharacterized protein n=1 Tax=Rhizophagus clarus TaxID=94130 RepID=A0A2Z6S276_9GLOM|nr:hypothetical protein RclHR1_08760012 [Rhizophagus clarus]
MPLRGFRFNCIRYCSTVQILLSAFVDPVFCVGEGSDNNVSITPTHINTSISLNLNFTTTLKSGVTAAGFPLAA